MPNKNLPNKNPAQQFLQFPKSEVGLYALDLAQLAKQDIPLPVSHCIPVSALKLIGRHNQLKAKFDQLQQATDFNDPGQIDKNLNKIQKLIRNQAYPPEVSKKLLDLYNATLDNDFIRLTASPVVGSETNLKREDNIQGEANMMESILKLWARNVDPTDFKRGILYPIAIVIQAQFQPTSSGRAFSLNPKTGEKSKITIRSVFGVYSLPESENSQDVFVMDQNSGHIEQEIAVKKEAFHRTLDKLKAQNLDSHLGKKPSLAKEQLQALAKLVRKIKLQSLEQIQVHWCLVRGRIIISKIKPYYFKPDKKITSDNPQYKTILIGISLTSGFVPGRCRIVQSEADLDKIKPGEIAVVKQLNHLHRPLIQNSSALICEQGVASTELLKTIRRYQLPAIVQTKNALRKLKNGQSIILDASAGKVYQVQSQTGKLQPLARTTSPKLCLAVNDFNEIDESLALISDGIGLFRSEHLFIQTGCHPRALLQMQSKQLEERLVNQFVNFYHRFINLKQKEPLLVYRSINLNTNQLEKLKGGSSREKKEINPLLGFRGGLRHLSQPQLLDFELQLLNKINSKIDQGIHLLLPFIRTSYELQQIQEKMGKNSSARVTQPQIWLQLTTPENLLNVKQYLKIPVGGVSINLKQIHGLLLGVDPYYKDVYDQYSLDLELIQPLLEKAVKDIKHKNPDIKILLNLTDFNQELIRLAHQLELDGVTVRPKFAQPAKELLIDLDS